jgi:hypothetical protein
MRLMVDAKARASPCRPMSRPARRILGCSGIPSSTLTHISSAPLLLFDPARAAARGIDESGFVSIGVIDQWISIQGRDTANPVVLYLHGGGKRSRRS